MATDDVDLCSQAFTLLGLGRITSMTAENNKSRIANQLYSTVINGLLASYPWRFATQKVELTRLLQTPETGYTYFFQLPPTIVGQPFVVYNSDDVGARPFKDWQIFEDMIATDATELWVDFRTLPLVSKFPGYFTQLAVYALAANFAMPATRDKSKMDAYMELAFGTPQEDGKGGYFRLARNADAFGQPPQEQRDNPFIDVRG